MAINETIINAMLPTALEPLANVIGRVMGVLQILVGGIFGLYFILVLLRLLEYRRMIKHLGDIKKEIIKLNENLTGKKPKKKR